MYPKKKPALNILCEFPEALISLCDCDVLYMPKGLALHKSFYHTHMWRCSYQPPTHEVANYNYKGPVIARIPEAYKAITSNDNKIIQDVLTSTVSCFAKLIQLLKRMDENISPEFFFHQLAPFFNGTDESQDAYPDGLAYEGVVPEVKKTPSTSAAQNSTIPTFDIFLGIQHKESTKKAFYYKRQQMPKHHRRFLEALEKQPSLREYIMTCGDPQLLATYNEALKGLSEFRSQHIVLVTRFVVIPFRNITSVGGEASDGNSTNEDSNDTPLPFMAHLQSSRNETSQSEL